MSNQPKGADTPQLTALKNAAEQFVAAHTGGDAVELVDYFADIFAEALAAPEGAGTSEPPDEEICKAILRDGIAWLPIHSADEAIGFIRWALGKWGRPAVAPEPAPVATFMGLRRTPIGTREFWGLLADGIETLPIGCALYAAPPAVVGARPSPAVVGEPALLRSALDHLHTMCGPAPRGDEWQAALNFWHDAELQLLGVESPLVFPDAGERGEPDVNLGKSNSAAVQRPVGTKRED